jgi:hypothetical protein
VSLSHPASLSFAAIRNENVEMHFQHDDTHPRYERRLSMIFLNARITKMLHGSSHEAERRMPPRLLGFRRLRTAMDTEASLVVLALTCLATLVQADEVAADIPGSDTASQTVSILSWIMAGACSFAALTIGYFSYLEDWLMTSYLQHNLVVLARVCSKSFARSLRGGGNDDGSAEYQVCFEYAYMTSEEKYPGTTTLVRKQARLTQRDFVPMGPPHYNNNLYISYDLDPPSSNFYLAGTKSSMASLASASLHPLPPVEQTGDLPPRELPPPEQPEGIYVLLLPGRVQSGIPQARATTICSWQYRCSTILLLLSIFAVAAFFWALPLLQCKHQARAALVTLLVVVVQVGFLHSCLSGILYRTLHEEYVEVGQVRLLHDDSTIPSVPTKKDIRPSTLSSSNSTANSFPYYDPFDPVEAQYTDDEGDDVI